MDIKQLTGRYLRVCQELGAAYSSLPWNTEHINRLTQELVAAERGIAAATGGCLEGTPLRRRRFAALLDH